MRHPSIWRWRSPRPCFFQTVSPSTRTFAAGGFRRPGAGDESCVSDANCSTGRKLVAYVTEVPVEKNAPTMPGNSLSSVVVTHGT
jgi:hypothetical protein